MSKLAALLGGMTLNDLAKEVLSLQGRGKDTELAHINKREAALLKEAGGSGGINPNTGMREFQDDYFGAEFTPDYSGFAQDQSYMGMPMTYEPSAQIPYAQPAEVVGQPFEEQYGQSIFAGQPTPLAGQGQTVSPSPEISQIPATQYPEGLPYDPGAGYGTARLPGDRPVTDVLGFTQGIGTQAQPTPEKGFGDTLSEYAKKLEDLAKAYPTLTRGAAAAAGGLPGLMQSRQARKEAAQTRAEMERMAAPIRAQGEAQLAAGQRGELTAAQQQQIEAARAAARQDLVRRGVTSGTAAQQAENRITELAQRFAQTNIDNGVRLIGAANTYNAAAIQMAYKMNQDANAMTQSYFTNLMRAYGALPTTEVTTTRTV